MPSSDSTSSLASGNGISPSSLSGQDGLEQNGMHQNGTQQQEPGSATPRNSASGPAAASENAKAETSPSSGPLSPTSPPPLRALLRRLLPSVLILADVPILYVAFVGGLKARHGSWMLPSETGFAVPLLLTLAAYLALLAAVGLYRMSPRDMHLPHFLKAGGALLGGWAASVTLMYLVDRHNIPPRSVTALHCLLSMVGILGLRAVLRQGLEWRDPPAGNAAPSSGTSRSAKAPLQLEDLLPRDAPAEVNTSALRDYLAGRTVLVTGAGGSIGTELVLQLLRLNPFRLVLVDISEYNLFQLENALRARSYDGELEFCIADVRDRSIMEGLFSDFRPDVVLHAAAYKHVPLMERHPAEAFRNNTLTAVTLLDLSRTYETEQFVFVSTDKAVEPASVLGATKRLAEWYVRSCEKSPVEKPPAENGTEGSGGPQCKIVRFGNVFGSQGSVAPLFEKQLREGGPVRVTHPEMERYFMSAHEACSLILQTLLMEDAPVYVFDMGDPVSIQRLAEEVVRRHYPGDDPREHIALTGVRPGEKLREKLATPEETVGATVHERISGLNSPVPYRRAVLEAYFEQLTALCVERQTAPLRKALFEENLPAKNTSTLHEKRADQETADPLEAKRTG